MEVTAENKISKQTSNEIVVEEASMVVNKSICTSAQQKSEKVVLNMSDEEYSEDNSAVTEVSGLPVSLSNKMLTLDINDPQEFEVNVVKQSATASVTSSSKSTVSSVMKKSSTSLIAKSDSNQDVVVASIVKDNKNNVDEIGIQKVTELSEKNEQKSSESSADNDVGTTVTVVVTKKQTTPNEETAVVSDETSTTQKAQDTENIKDDVDDKSIDNSCNNDNKSEDKEEEDIEEINEVDGETSEEIVEEVVEEEEEEVVDEDETESSETFKKEETDENENDDDKTQKQEANINEFKNNEKEKSDELENSEKLELRKNIGEEEVTQNGDEELKDENQTADEIDLPKVVNQSTIKDNTGEEEQRKKENFSNAIKEIISDIDTDISEQSYINSIKQQKEELLKKQKELAEQIEIQQLLAKQLAEENLRQQQQLKDREVLLKQQLKIDAQIQQQQQQKLEQQKLEQQQQQQQQLPQVTTYPEQNVSEFTSFEERYKDGNLTCTKEIESYRTKETSNVTNKIDLRKIFTPATDTEEIQPKNRKLYASSAFYSPSLHPTVEDQVELARRISHSLSDISNQKSKGQSMYVNRKKRSVKWVHEGCGQDVEDELKENKETVSESSPRSTPDRIPLRLLMNPRGQTRDFDSLRDSLNTETGLLSPDKCAEVVTALHTHQGKGAELFAKRRKKAEKWVVDETNAGNYSPSGIPDYQQYQPKSAVLPSVLPAYSEVGKHRLRNKMHQESVLEKYAKPGLKVVTSPWEAALTTGSASTAFVEDQRRSPYVSTPTLLPASEPQYVCGETPLLKSSAPGFEELAYEKDRTAIQSPKVASVSHQKDLAYKPSVPQGWNAPSVTLPKANYHQNQIEYHEQLLSHSTQQSHSQYQVSENDEHCLELMLKSLKSSDFSHSNQLIPEKYTDRAEIGLHEHQEPQEQHPKEDFIKKEIYDFPKVIVKDLILNFENHINGFVQPNDIFKCDEKEKENMLKSKSIQHSSSSETLQTDQFQISNEIKIEKQYQEPTDSYEELYVPKDIPLESYAPPPTSSPIKTNYNHEWKPSTNFLGSQFSELSRSNEPTQTQNVCNVPTYSPLISNISKEQSCVQNNCMTAPQNIRQVNFSPSPLPYDKLAKFDSPTSPPSFNNNYTGNRLSRSNLTIGSSAVRNISPKPFGHVASGTISPKLGAPLSPNYSTPVTETPLNQYYNTSGRSTSQNISSSNILHGSNFNNSAQGWQKKAPTAVSHAPLNTQLHVGGNLPYTDF